MSPTKAGHDPRGLLEAIETTSVDELRAIQLERLRWSLRHAYERVGFYRQGFDAAGVHPDDITRLDDLARLPFTTSDDLRRHYPFGLFAVPREQVVRVHTSGGTTGKPTVVGYTRKDIEAWAQLMARSIRAAGGRPGDLCHIAYGYGLRTAGLGAHYGAERLGCTVVPVSGGQTEQQVMLINDFKPRIIMVTPSYCLKIADEFDRQGLDARRCSLAIGIFGSEPWTGELRGEIESRLGIDATDSYGLSELNGPGVAQECLETKDGLTIWEDFFYPEIVDPHSGKLLAEGELGELVFTSLARQAMPVIRYRTHELTRLLPGSARSMRRMDRIAGRSDDMMIIRGVNVFPSQIEELIIKMRGLSPHYQLELTRVGHLDALTVNVERIATNVEVLGVAERLRHEIKSYVGVSARVVVREPGSVPRTPDQAQRIVDKRKPQN